MGGAPCGPRFELRGLRSASRREGPGALVVRPRGDEVDVRPDSGAEVQSRGRRPARARMQRAPPPVPRPSRRRAVPTGPRGDARRSRQVAAGHRRQARLCGSGPPRRPRRGARSARISCRTCASIGRTPGVCSTRGRRQAALRSTSTTTGGAGRQRLLVHQRDGRRWPRICGHRRPSPGAWAAGSLGARWGPRARSTNTQGAAVRRMGDPAPADHKPASPQPANPRPANPRADDRRPPSQRAGRAASSPTSPPRPAGSPARTS